jgi:hypothetical protein
MKKGVSPSPRVEASVVDGEHREGQLPVPVVLASVGVGAQRITDDAVSQLYLGVGVAVAVARVGTACTLPDSKSTWF